MRQHYSWCIARLGVDEKSRIVGRYFNRQDAEDSLKLLNRLMRRKMVKSPGFVFVVFFDPPDDLENRMLFKEPCKKLIN